MTETTPAAHSGSYWKLCVAICAGIIVTGALSVGDYGLPWDDTVQARYGELSLQYFTSGFEDSSCNDYLNLRYYGPLFEMVMAAAYASVPAWRIEIRHAGIAIAAFLTLVGVALYARSFHDPLMPLFSLLALITMPRFFGHAFNNSKDIPFACFFVWSMVALVYFYRANMPVYRRACLCGFAFGLAMSIRVGGVMIPVLFVVTGLMYLVGNRREIDNATYVRRWLLSLCVVCSLAWTVMVTFWPWAHESPILNPWRSLKMSADFAATHEVLFEGRRLASTSLPRYYIPKYLMITVPVSHIILAVVGMIAAITAARGVTRRHKHGDQYVHIPTLLWITVPLLYAVSMKPNVYDGMRHFLFLLPATAVLTATGAVWILRRCKRGRLRHVVRVGLIALLLAPAVDLVRLHPYQSTYFNCLAGGLGSASEDYETDYWITSYKEAAEWVNAELSGSGGTILLAANQNSRACAEAFLEPNIISHAMFKTGISGRLPAGIDYYVATTRYQLNANFPDAPVVHTIGRDKAVFTVIKGR